MAAHFPVASKSLCGAAPRFAAQLSLVLLAGCTIIGSMAACGGKSKGKGGKLMPSDRAKSVPEVDPELCDTKGKQVTTYDLNRDNRPDVWKLFKQVKEGGARLQILSCKQVDLDHDGKKDYVVAYDKKGAKLFEKTDSDFDGRFDTYYQFDPKTGHKVEAQRESGFDGRFDVQEVYDESGQLTSVRIDRNGDGKADRWEQYVKGRLVAILYDNDFDSKVDRRDEIAVEDTESDGEKGSASTPSDPAQTPGGTDQAGSDQAGGN
ncbi:MAG: hypothetical protein MJE77_33475 [Proteobacteria bacterium]|nr:hypothetical protein [Pseudomonadota bacterium]